MNSTIAWIAKGASFNVPEEFKNEYRVVTADLRNAYDGQTTLSLAKTILLAACLHGGNFLEDNGPTLPGGRCRPSPSSPPKVQAAW